MKKVAGIATILVIIAVFSWMIQPTFMNPYNVRNILRWTGLFGLLSLGEAFVIITAGIDLSVGSVVGMIGAFAANWMVEQQMSVPLVLVSLMIISMILGSIHGFFVAKVKMQPFVVTLCGLFIYRGFTRFAMRDAVQGYGNQFTDLKLLTKGKIPELFWPGEVPQFIQDWSLPVPFVILLIMAGIFAIFLNRTIYGRYILALGRNEQAARFSGINTDRMIIVAYMLSTLCAGIAGILFSLDLNTVQPSATGNMYELYAIAGCVVGGVSLAGGEGSILGVLIGVAIVRVLYNAINILGIATQLEMTVIGLVILIGVGADVALRNYAAKRHLKEAREMKTPPQ